MFDINAALNALVQQYQPGAPKVDVSNVLKGTDDELKKIYADAVKALKEQGGEQSKLNAEFAPLTTKLNTFLAYLMQEHLSKMRAVLKPQQLEQVHVQAQSSIRATGKST